MSKKPSIKDLRKKLEYVESIYSNRWNMCRLLVDYMNEHRDKVSVKWLSRGGWESKVHYNDDIEQLFDFKTWSTYDLSCIDLKFSTKGDKLECYASIFEGGNFRGERRGLRFRAEIILPFNFIKNLKEEIEEKVEYFLISEHKRFLEEEAKKWMNNRYDELFKGEKG